MGYVQSLFLAAEIQLRAHTNALMAAAVSRLNELCISSADSEPVSDFGEQSDQ